MKCAEPMRLALIEPRSQGFDLLTYLCIPCDTGESFLRAMWTASSSQAGARDPTFAADRAAERCG